MADQTYIIVLTYINWSKNSGQTAQRAFSGKNSEIVEKNANKWIRKSTHCEITDDSRMWVEDTELHAIFKRTKGY